MARRGLYANIAAKRRRIKAGSGVIMRNKKLSRKQRKIASAAPPRRKITGADFKELKKRKKKRA
jgi:hypothetical protein